LFEQYAVYDKKGVPSGTRLTILYGLQWCFNQLTKNITLSSEIPSDYDSLIRKN
jgi:hypothetical protein